MTTFLTSARQDSFLLNPILLLLFPAHIQEKSEGRRIHMSFLESVQHGIEKAAQEAARLAKIQHLHSVIHDLQAQSDKQCEDLVTEAIQLSQASKLDQKELQPFSQQI